MNRALVNRLFAAMAMLSLASCSVLPKREPLKIYEPAPASAQIPAAWPSVSWSLVVGRPSTGQTLDSERISVRPVSGEVQVYKGAIWSDDVADLMQTRLLQRLEDSGKILAVSRPGSGMRGQYQLQMELRSFDSIYKAEKTPPEATIEVRARLVAVGNGEVIAARSFQQSQTASSEDITDVVAAFSQSLARIDDEIVGWTLDSGQADSIKKKL